MNPTVKAKWIEALRSGDYEQGKDALYMDGKYCCLGVLCHLYAKETNEGQFSPPIKPDWPWRFECMESSSEDHLPQEVRWWAGLPDSSGGMVLVDGVANWLTDHNDKGVPFAVLADAIEAQL